MTQYTGTETQMLHLPFLDTPILVFFDVFFRCPIFLACFLRFPLLSKASEKRKPLLFSGFPLGFLALFFSHKMFFLPKILTTFVGVSRGNPIGGNKTCSFEKKMAL